MIEGKIYFQRANKYWSPTKDLKLNAYLNVLSYVNHTIDERLLNVALGGHIPCYKNNLFEGKRIGEEKVLSYTTGLYYEEYNYDSKEEFFAGILKNLKMRIALVIVYGKICQLNNTSNNLPMVCCGINENDKTLIVINPSNGKYEVKCIEECFGEKGKFVILNVPGMVKMKGIDKTATVIASMKLYINRFCNFKDSYTMDMTGLDFFAFCKKNKVDLKQISGFMSHRNIQLRWLYDMSALLKETEAKKYILIINIFIKLYENSIDLCYEDEIDCLCKIDNY